MRAVKPKLSHVDEHGAARMVDVSAKAPSVREATASAVVTMRKEVLRELLRGRLAKGDVLATARIAGMLGAKRTGELIPLCHPLAVDWLDVRIRRLSAGRLRVECVAKVAARTGVEMEAMTGACVAALTVYDMVKSMDKGARIGPIQLERKTGGKSGSYQRTRRT